MVTKLTNSVNLSHRQVGRINFKTLDMLKSAEETSVRFGDRVSPRDMRSGKRKQLAHFKKTFCDVSGPSHPIYADQMGPFSPAALKTYNYVGIITGQQTKYREVYEIKSKADIVGTMKLFVEGVLKLFLCGTGC